MSLCWDLRPRIWFLLSANDIFDFMDFLALPCSSTPANYYGLGFSKFFWIISTYCYFYVGFIYPNMILPSPLVPIPATAAGPAGPGPLPTAEPLLTIDKALPMEFRPLDFVLIDSFVRFLELVWLCPLTWLYALWHRTTLGSSLFVLIFSLNCGLLPPATPPLLIEIRGGKLLRSILLFPRSFGLFDSAARTAALPVAPASLSFIRRTFLKFASLIGLFDENWLADPFSLVVYWALSDLFDVALLRILSFFIFSEDTFDSRIFLFARKPWRGALES